MPTYSYPIISIGPSFIICGATHLAGVPLVNMEALEEIFCVYVCLPQ